MRSLGLKISRKRVELKLTQAGLSRGANVDRSQLAEIEQGKANVKIGTLRAIARALRITTSDLLKGINEFDDEI